MTEPLVITISHRLGRAEAKRRLDAGLGHIRAAVVPYVGALDMDWQGDRLLFHVMVLRQGMEGAIEVADELVRIEITAPVALRVLAGIAARRIRREGMRLLEKPAPKE